MAFVNEMFYVLVLQLRDSACTVKFRRRCEGSLSPSLWIFLRHPRPTLKASVPSLSTKWIGRQRLDAGRPDMRSSARCQQVNTKDTRANENMFSCAVRETDQETSIFTLESLVALWHKSILKIIPWGQLSWFLRDSAPSKSPGNKDFSRNSTWNS